MPVTFDTEVMARDVFPAEVLMPDGSLIRAARVFATDQRVMVFAVVKDRIELVGELILSEPGSVPADRGTMPVNGRLEVRTADGTAWVNRDKGCGCSSPLKAMGLPIPWTRRG